MMMPVASMLQQQLLLRQQGSESDLICRHLGLASHQPRLQLLWREQRQVIAFVLLDFD
jgi:hypothetical protein